MINGERKNSQKISKIQKFIDENKKLKKSKKEVFEKGRLISFFSSSKN